MNALVLCLPLLFADPASIEFAWAQATVCEPQEQSVVTSDTTAKPVAETPKQEQFTTRQETRYRWVRQKKCYGSYCRYVMVRQPYTVTVKVPVESASTKTWPRYPTTPRQRPWTQGGRHITWRHLTQGEHAGKFDQAWLQSLTQLEVEQLHADEHENKVQWAYVVRP